MALVLLAIAAVAGAAPAPWQQAALLPAPALRGRSRPGGGQIFVVGGFTPAGDGLVQSRRLSPTTNRWRQALDLPVTTHHPAAAGYRGRLYVAGGYGGNGQPLAAAHVLANGRWSALPAMPEKRAAAGPRSGNGKLYVVGGVVRTDGRRLATKALRYDPARRRWTRVPGRRPASTSA